LIRRAALAIVLAAAAACGKHDGPAPAMAGAPAGAPAPANTGLATITGHAPASEPHHPVVVTLEPRSARTFPAQDDIPVMDQANLTFSPELLLVRTGQPVEFHNSDETLHNVRVSHQETRTSAFNVAIPTGEVYTYSFDKDGFYSVGCDIHPEMSASIFASSSPFAGIVDNEGAFSFPDVPPGAWTVTVYAKGNRLQKDVDVAAGATTISIP
jgi:plastocyanin